MPDGGTVVPRLTFTTEAVVPPCAYLLDGPRILGHKAFLREDGSHDLIIILDVMPTSEEERQSIREFIEVWLKGNHDMLCPNEIIVISMQDPRTGIYDRI